MAGTDRIIAVAEFYQKTDELQSELNAAQRRSWLVVAGVMSLTFILLSGFVKRASDTIDHQKVELSNQVTRLTELLGQNRELHERVRRAAARVTTLNEGLLRRIGSELHDGPAQDLSLALLKLDTIIGQSEVCQFASINGLPCNSQMIAIQSATQNALKELRAISTGLGLPELAELSLTETVMRVVHAHERRTNTKVDLELSELPVHTPLPVKITLYRLIQEALNNSYSHAGGKGQKVSVMTKDSQIIVEISDQGPGFDLSQALRMDNHLGIAGMRERVESLGGNFSIETKEGKGTLVRWILNLLWRAPNMSDKIRVVIVDDHPLFREGVATILGNNPAFEVVGQGASADEAINLSVDLLPDLLLLDIDMPGNGIKAAMSVAAACPVTKIVFLTVSESDDNLVAALKAGGRAYILKGVAGRELIRILQTVNEGESYVPPALAASLLMDLSDNRGREKSHDNPMDELTERERQILELLGSGLSNKEIGAKLYISEKTVKHYMTNILQKLQVRNRVEAALIAQKSGYHNTER